MFETSFGFSKKYVTNIFSCVKLCEKEYV